MTSKFLSEANDRFQHPYALFALELLPKLVPDGFAIFLDVTNPQSPERGGQWANLQMYNELNVFQREESEFHTLFPMVCDGCVGCSKISDRGTVFPQFLFSMWQAGFPSSYKSHVACRVMCRDTLWKRVRPDVTPACWPLMVTREKFVCYEEGGENNVVDLPACCCNYDYFQ